jgi:hypothetical protein
MKDLRDKKTPDLLAQPGRPRQAAYVARMQAAGFRQRTFWLSAEESDAVDNLVNTMRQTTTKQ